MGPGPVRTGPENLVPNGIRSSDGPAGNESLYRLRYPDSGRRGYKFPYITTHELFVLGE